MLFCANSASILDKSLLPVDIHLEDSYFLKLRRLAVGWKIFEEVDSRDSGGMVLRSELVGVKYFVELVKR